MDLEIGIKSLSDALTAKKISSVELCQHLHAKAIAANKQLNCFININYAEIVLDRANLADNLRAHGEGVPATFGVPIGYKDNVCVKNCKTTCASLMLSNFNAPYNATLVDKCAAQGMINLGKTNMDEFAMGSSNETSYFGTCHNPWSIQHVPGGSSGGSAAAVAARLVPAAIGTDTGGSVRQPSAFCGVCGLKPTYGRVSRWGVVAFASSLDQAGPIATSAEDCAILFDIISGHDNKDSTLLNSAVPKTVPRLNDSIKGKVLGFPKQYFAELIEPDILKNIEECISVYKKLGVTFKEIDIPHHEYAAATYYVIATAEASSNLSRFDGVRFGYRAQDTKSLEEMYLKTRGEAFGAEVKRRIMTGCFVLSSGYYEAYYNKAQLLRQKIRADYLKALEGVDAILAPTTRETAHPIGYKKKSAKEKYTADQFTVSANLSGIPAFAMPTGLNQEGLPTSVQLIGKHDDEALLLNLAHQYQQHTNWHKMQPTIILEADDE